MKTCENICSRQSIIEVMIKQRLCFFLDKKEKKWRKLLLIKTRFQFDNFDNPRHYVLNNYRKTKLID